jgi:hypothetical protein
MHKALEARLQVVWEWGGSGGFFCGFGGCCDGFYKGLVSHRSFWLHTTIINMADEVILVLLKTSTILDIPAMDVGIAEVKAEIGLWEVSTRKLWVVLVWALTCSTVAGGTPETDAKDVSSHQGDGGGAWEMGGSSWQGCGVNGRQRWCAVRKMRQLWSIRLRWGRSVNVAHQKMCQWWWWVSSFFLMVEEEEGNLSKLEVVVAVGKMGVHEAHHAWQWWVDIMAYAEAAREVVREKCGLEGEE